MAQPVEQTVPRAVPGPISDQQLQMAIDAAAALNGDWSVQKPEKLGSDLNLISVLAHPLLLECQQHRLRLSAIADNAKTIQDMAERDNVTFLKP